MKYKKLTGIILKKQNYREADQIVSVFTREAGKVRCLAKSLRHPKSKLNYAVQDLSESEISVVGGNLPILISAKPIRQFAGLRDDLKKTAIAFYAGELMLKMTADEHPNETAYDLLQNFLINLNHHDFSEKYHPLLECFSLDLLDTLGFRIPKDLDSERVMKMNIDEIEQTHRTINKFIEYILERNIKSEAFLISV